MSRVIWAIVAATLCTSPAMAGENRDAVLDLLNAFELPGSETDFKALGEGIDTELMAIAEDATVPTSRRGRAVSALQFYPNNVVQEFLVGHLAAADKSLIRRKAAYSLAAGWGEASIVLLQSSLVDEDVQLRIAVVNALGNVDADLARKLLTEHKRVETEDAVKTAIETVLAKAVKK
ncbi:MAG: hypothetical protein GWP91_22525 [Rhodobacterales bacterium]|nr:hypothetical protein [Rhodobacterales bacterium]